MLASLHAACSMPAPRNPLKTKGAGAWANAKGSLKEMEGGGLGSGSGVHRLLVHAVDDKTNLVYEKAVRRFLGEARRHNLPFDSYVARGATMARHHGALLMHPVRFHHTPPWQH